MNSPFEVRLSAVAGARHHRHGVRLSHHTPGSGLQLPVDTFHSHEARLALRAPFQGGEGEERKRAAFVTCHHK